MHIVTIELRIDDDTDPAQADVTLSVDGATAAVGTADPAAWRDITTPAMRLLGEPARAAVVALEQSILSTVRERHKHAADESKRNAAAINAWDAVTTKEQP